MMVRVQRWILAGMALLGTRGCSNDDIVVWLHVKNVTAEMKTLQVAVTLDGRPAPQRYEFTQGLGEIALRIRKQQIGLGLLSVDLTGLTDGGCLVAKGRYETTVSADMPLREMEVTLANLSPARCSLSVDRVGDGSVTSIPAGVNCGTSCTMEVEMGTKVTLTAMIATPYSGSFWEGCDGVNDTCEVTVAKAQKVSVHWGPEVRPNLVKVPKGSFTMGSPAAESGRGSNEVQHAVTLTTDFWMAESEVTQRQYRNLMGGSPSGFKGDDLPVESVSWYDAVAYCNALSVKEKLTPCYQISGTTVGWADGVKCTGYRLPTEAEWEYAANPVTPPRTIYAGSDTVDAVAWYSSNASSMTHAVKTKAANGRGLYDLSGNVWEWVWDNYQPNYEDLPLWDPIGPPTGAVRVVRGGAWCYAANLVRTAVRNAYVPTDAANFLGLRIVRSKL